MENLLETIRRRGLDRVSIGYTVAVWAIVQGDSARSRESSPGRTGFRKPRSQSRCLAFRLHWYLRGSLLCTRSMGTHVRQLAAMPLYLPVLPPSLSCLRLRCRWRSGRSVWTFNSKPGAPSGLRCRAAVSQFERGSKEGLFQRGHSRSAYQHAFSNSVAACRRAYFLLCVRKKEAGREVHRALTQRAFRAGGFGAWRR